MNDLALNPLTGDLLITGLDLSVIKGADRARQNLEIKLKLWQGEWFLDTEFGTPYIDQILGKQITLSGSVAALKKSILEVSDVSGIESFKYNYDRQARSMKVDFSCSTPYGLIRMNT